MNTNMEIQPATHKNWVKNEDWIEPVEKIPVWVKPFVGKTAAQFLGKFFPQKTIEAIAGLISGIVPNFGVLVPDWTRQASCQFWKYYGFPKVFNPQESVKDFGVLVGLIEQLICLPSLEPTHPAERWLTKAAPKLIAFLADKIVQSLTDFEKSQFFAGKHQANEIISRMKNPSYLDMTKLAQLYLVVSAMWKKVESLDTHAAREKWLRAEKIIKDNVSSREVYQAFSVIGLPGAKPGKPKQVQT